MDAAIVAFWDWFTASHESVQLAYRRNETVWLDGELSTRVRAIHPRLNWEMGPYHHPDQTLVISPSIRENIGLAQRVVESAPTVVGWRFLPAKPSKVLKRLRMELPGVPGVAVCADSWVYRLTAYNRLEFFDIEVFTNVGTDVSDRHLLVLTRQLIETLVGESVFLEQFADVKLYRPSDPPPDAELSQFPSLGRHVSHLLQQRDEDAERGAAADGGA